MWGGWYVFPGAIDGGNKFWLVQGEWLVPYPTNYDYHGFGQWVGLGCCGDVNADLLMQGGTEYQTNACNPYCNATYNFFWNVPQNGTRRDQPFGPAVGPEYVAAFVVHTDAVFSYYEACNETTSQCAFTTQSIAPGVPSNEAQFEVEDNTPGASPDPPYPDVVWGPQNGPNNQNIVDAVNEPNQSFQIGNLPSWIEQMSMVSGGNWPTYISPETVDGYSNFLTCNVRATSYGTVTC